MQWGPRVTAKAPHISLANTVGYVVILASERPFTQDRSVLGQKMPPSILTYKFYSEKNSILCVRFSFYPLSICLSLTSASCLSVYRSSGQSLPPISHSFRDHWLMCLCVRLCYSSSCMKAPPSSCELTHPLQVL